MPETLLSHSNILLIGRLVTDLIVKHDQGAGGAMDQGSTHAPSENGKEGCNKFLSHQLGLPDAQFARIYGFSYEGHYYDLPRPALLLVHGDGEEAEHRVPESPAAVAPDTADKTGVAAEEYSFSEDMRVWSYDKGDYSIRMDVDSGTLEEILLEATLSDEDSGGTYAGARVAGARVAGARVAGARVAGARVAGARLAGGRGRGEPGD